MGKERGRGGEGRRLEGRLDAGRGVSSLDQWLRQSFGGFLFLFWPLMLSGRFFCETCEICFLLLLFYVFVCLFVLVRFVLLTNRANTVFLCRNPLLRSCPMPSASH